MKTSPLTSGALARAAGVHVETLRFYERQGLLAPPRRTSAGYRQYPADAVGRLRFIKRAQALGFSLNDVAALLSLRTAPGRQRARVKRLAEEKLSVIAGKIRDLQRMETSLRALAESCSGVGPLHGCPIIEALEGGE